MLALGSRRHREGHALLVNERPAVDGESSRVDPITRIARRDGPCASSCCLHRGGERRQLLAATRAPGAEEQQDRGNCPLPPPSAGTETSRGPVGPTLGRERGHRSRRRHGAARSCSGWSRSREQVRCRVATARTMPDEQEDLARLPRCGARRRAATGRRRPLGRARTRRTRRCCVGHRAEDVSERGCVMSTSPAMATNRTVR